MIGRSAAAITTAVDRSEAMQAQESDLRRKDPETIIVAR
jgi:hypothetical protein